jgi:ribosomal protein S20
LRVYFFCPQTLAQAAEGVKIKQELSQLRTFMKEYQQRCEEKVQVLKSNLARAEQEVASLDAELARVLASQHRA